MAGDELLGTDGGASAAAGTLGVVDGCQILNNGDGAVGADLGAQTAANAALGAALDNRRALGVGVTGDNGVVIVVNRHDQLTGTGFHTSTAADTHLPVHLGNAVDDVNGVVLTGLDTITEAQAAEFADHRAVSGYQSSGGTVLHTFVYTFSLRAQLLAVLGDPMIAGAADQSHLTFDLPSLYTHNGGHGLCAFIAAGVTFSNGCFTVEHSLRIAATAGIAAATAVGTG